MLNFRQTFSLFLSSLLLFYHGVINAPILFGTIMVRNYKKKEGVGKKGGRRNYANDPDMVAAYEIVMRKEMSMKQAAKFFEVSRGSLIN